MYGCIIYVQEEDPDFLLDHKAADVVEWIALLHLRECVVG
jgi:hypothetical protein